MKMKLMLACFLMILLNSCIIVPQETIALSRVLGQDIASLQESHIEVIDLYYDKIIADIEIFVDEVYAPFVIQYVLKQDLENYKDGQVSIFGSIENIEKVGGELEMEKAIVDMREFQEAANNQIQIKRKELLEPIFIQEEAVVNQINRHYKNAQDANNTITNYLLSIRKLKESQQQTFAIAGIGDTNRSLTSSLVGVSNLVHEAVLKGKMIDVKSKEAFESIEDISNQIKNLTLKL